MAAVSSVIRYTVEDSRYDACALLRFHLLLGKSVMNQVFSWAGRISSKPAPEIGVPLGNDPQAGEIEHPDDSSNLESEPASPASGPPGAN